MRSAITFDSFNGSVSKFNSTAFKFAVMDALNTDRLQYSGSEKGKELFAKVKTKDVSVIVVDPMEKTVQFEVARKGGRRRNLSHECCMHISNSLWPYFLQSMAYSIVILTIVPGIRPA